MDEDLRYTRAVSLHLSRTLDRIGVNSMIVKQRREVFLYSEKVDDIYGLIKSSYLSSKYDNFSFGSQVEGATTLGLGSDLDSLVLLDGYNVMQDWSHWEMGKMNLLMLQENTAPGYCRLQLLRSDIPAVSQVVPNECFTYDGIARVIMKNAWLHNIQEPGVTFVRNGPAASTGGSPGQLDCDIVQALGCRSWPEQAHSFKTRPRRYNWPNQRLIRRAVKQGVFLVPVGYKLSPTEHLEWRISASLAERYLMFSLSIVHIKCYVVLKMLIKTFVEPCVGKSISSYHCKTAVFYCTENTEPEFWREDNLLQCVTQCLRQLLSWVAMGFCPQFIMSEENLFAGKVTSQNKSTLQSLLTDLLESNDYKILDVKKLLVVEIDLLGSLLQIVLNTVPSTIPVLDSFLTIRLHALLGYEKPAIVDTCLKHILLLHKSTPLSTVICVVYQWIVMLNDRMRHSNGYELQAVKSFIELFYRWLGSLLASIALSRNTRVSRVAIQLLYLGGNYDVTSMLKLASVFYCNGDARKVEAILHRLEQYYSRHELQPSCTCYFEPRNPSEAFCRELFALKSRRKRNKRFTHCVRFPCYEIHCAPPALWHELFRSIGEDMHHRNPVFDRWMDLAVVDCLPYLYFLQYMTYRQLGQRDLQTRARNNLNRCIREDDTIRHLETAWNLLGQCLELEQQPEAAMTCYIRSLAIRERNNAAKWHVAILCYRLISKKNC